MTALLLAFLPQILTTVLGFGAAKLHTKLASKPADQQALAAQVASAVADALKQATEK